jgi:RsiW-degrading membrane proteinase PrsW (M82 family)
MPLWSAVLIFIIIACGFLALLLLTDRKKKKVFLIAGSFIIGALLVSVIVYVALTFVLVEGID